MQLLFIDNNPTFTNQNTSILFIKIITSISGPVNLDFFRLVYPPFCLHPKANVFAILSLDYLVALYPFLLIFLTYLLVTAHDKRYRLVVWMWRPLKMYVHRHRNTCISLTILSSELQIDPATIDLQCSCVLIII